MNSTPRVRQPGRTRVRLARDAVAGTIIGVTAEHDTTQPRPVPRCRPDGPTAIVSGGWLRPTVFGAVDGLVTNAALIAGLGGGGVSAHTGVLTGGASLGARAF